MYGYFIIVTRVSRPTKVRIKSFCAIHWNLGFIRETVSGRGSELRMDEMGVVCVWGGGGVEGNCNSLCPFLPETSFCLLSTGTEVREKRWLRMTMGS